MVEVFEEHGLLCLLRCGGRLRVLCLIIRFLLLLFLSLIFLSFFLVLVFATPFVLAFLLFPLDVELPLLQLLLNSTYVFVFLFQVKQILQNRLLPQSREEDMLNLFRLQIVAPLLSNNKGNQICLVQNDN